MIDFSKYDFDEDDLDFIERIKEDIDNLNEVTLEYNGKGFVLEPSGCSIQVYAYNEILGDYENFDDLLLHHKIDGRPLIELVKELEFGD